MPQPCASMLAVSMVLSHLLMVLLSVGKFIPVTELSGNGATLAAGGAAIAVVESDDFDEPDPDPLQQ
jgi:hypothetical protein